MLRKNQPSSEWVHRARVGLHVDMAIDPEVLEKDQIEKLRENIESWIAALLQVDHLNLLIGNGLTTAIAGTKPVDMSTHKLDCAFSRAVHKAATSNARKNDRREPNIEYTIRAARELIEGLKVVAMEPDSKSDFVKQAKALKLQWSRKLNKLLDEFRYKVLDTEKHIRSRFEHSATETSQELLLLESFLLSFASRTATRERLHVFTTNYDRLIEFGADLIGLRIMDRFVGGLEPVFHASRLGIDMHYNPPGILNEPRYLDGVIRMTKLHGSIDWQKINRTGKLNQIARTALPFGADQKRFRMPARVADSLMIYPNPAKDIETIEYPYAELFRDFAAAVCQPNTVLVTYGYGFGDDHINRILQDMLTIPSTHIVIISFDDADGRIPKFWKDAGRSEQISLLIGPHFGDLKTLVNYYLPKPAIEGINQRRAELLKRRQLQVQTPNIVQPQDDKPQTSTEGTAQ